MECEIQELSLEERAYQNKKVVLLAEECREKGAPLRVLSSLCCLLMDDYKVDVCNFLSYSGSRPVCLYDFNPKRN